MEIKELIQEMTLYEKASLLSGKTQFDSQEIDRLKIPSISFADGPHGIRKQLGSADNLGLNESAKATCFPTLATLGNSWDKSLIMQVGEALGKEALFHQVDVLLGPGLNIKRNPRCGRNFEYLSEDPYLSGKLAASYIRGVQTNGTIATPKHFAINNQEYKRMVSDSILDERTLREIYLTGFEIALKEGKPKALMSSYNLVNGVYTHESRQLLVDILKNEWQFDGFVVSDWGGSNDHVLATQNGSHIEMPGTGINAPMELVEAVQNGTLSETDLDEAVETLLKIILNSNAQKEATAYDEEKHHRLAQKAAEKSIVLLKNTKQILPLQKEEAVAFVGDFIFKPRYQGAGSSLINPTNLETIENTLGTSKLNVKQLLKGELNQNLNEKIKDVETVVLFLGLDEASESEGMDRPNILMPQKHIDLLKHIKKQGKKTIVVLSAGSVVDVSWEKQADAIVHGYLSGQAGASAILGVLEGRVNPSGKLAETYPLKESDIPFNDEYPYQGKYAYYKEGIFVGYRYYDTNNKRVSYPFGYGLSYTDFSYSHLKVDEKGVSFKIKNEGDYEGEDIVQLYIGKKDSLIPRPKKELKGFKKVSLKPQESKIVHISFDEQSFRHYSSVNGRWEIEGGVYEIYLGKNVNEIILEDKLWVNSHHFDQDKLDPIYPSYFKGDIAKSTLDDLAILMQKESIEVEVISNIMNVNSTIMDLEHAQSGLMRLISKTLKRKIKRNEKKNKPDLNLLFLYNMPFRAMTKMTNGLIDTPMIKALVTISNGQFIKGTKALLHTSLQNRKRKKKFRQDKKP